MENDQNAENDGEPDISLDFEPRYSVREYEQPRKQFLKVVKYFLFKSFNLMTEFCPVQASMYCCLLVIELLQFMSFLFTNLEVTNIDSSKSSEDLHTYFKPQEWFSFFDLQAVLLDINSSPLHIAAFSVIGCLLCALWITMIVLHSKCDDGYQVIFTNSSCRFAILLCSLFSVLLQKVLFTPFLYTLVLPMFCYRKESTGQLWNDYLEEECWTGILQPVLFGFGLVLGLLMGAQCIIHAIIFNDPRAKAKIPWGTAVSKAELIKLAMKANMVIGVLVMRQEQTTASRQDSHYSSISLLIFQVSNLLLCLLLIHQRFFYNFMANRQVLYFTILSEASLSWLSLMLCFVNLTRAAISPFDYAYMILSLVCFDIFALLFSFHRCQPYRLTCPPEQESEAQTEQYFLHLYQYFAIKKSSSLNRIILLGLVKKHMYECADANCQCQQLLFVLCENKLKLYFEEYLDFSKFDGTEEDRSELRSLKVQEKTDGAMVEQKQKMISNFNKQVTLDLKFKHFLFSFFDSLLKKANNRLAKSMRLKFLHITLLKGELNNEFKSYFQILKLLRTKPSFEWEYYLVQSKQRVEQIMYRKYQDLLQNKQTIDCIKVFDFEQHFITFEKHIITTAITCLKFWKELMDRRLDVNRIHDFGVQISHSYSHVNGLASKMLSLFPNHLLLLKIYAFFLSQVMNNEQEAVEYYAKARGYIRNYQNSAINRFKDEDKYFGYNSRTVIISITVTHKDIGRIINANFETKRLLGYQNQEVKNRNVRILMPKILADNHDAFIKNYFETAKAKILEKQRVVFAKNKAGYIIPVTILIKAIPNLQRKLTFIGFMKRLEADSPFLQLPPQFAGADYHIIMTDSEGQIFGFTENCWEAFGFKPSFFFNRFGDPEQSIRIDKIIRNVRDQSFLMRLEQKQHGMLCTLDTIQVMENVSRELLTKAEQEVLLSISGSYNINLHIEEEAFNNGKVMVKLYKIIKLSRIIRELNVFEVILANSDKDMGSNEGSDDFGRNFDFQRIQDSLNQDDDLLAAKSNSSSETFDQNSVSSIDLNQSNSSLVSTDLHNFKKTIARKEMPSSIHKLNLVVIGFVILILLVSFLDFSSNLLFYQRVETEETFLLNLFQFQKLVSRIGANVLTMALIKAQVQPDTFENFTMRSEMLNESLKYDQEQLQTFFLTLNSPVPSLVYFMADSFDLNADIPIKDIEQNGEVRTDQQSFSLSMQRYISRLQQLLYSDMQNQTQLLVAELFQVGVRKQTNRTVSDSQKSVYFLVENSLFALNSFCQNGIAELLIWVKDAVRKQRLGNVAIYAFFMVFVGISGMIVFPIVIKVQKNKVMILGIYFELPHEEIERVYQKCHFFLTKIECKFHGGPATSGTLFNEMQHIEGQKRRAQSQDSFSKSDVQEEAKDDSLVSASRDLPSSTHLFRNKNQDRYQRRMGQRKEAEFQQMERQGSLAESSSQSVELQRKQKTKVVRKKDKGQGEEEFDPNEMFKQIKVKNKKINLVTLFLIVCYMVYFSVNFYLKADHLKQLNASFQVSQVVFSLVPSICNTYLFFLQSTMRNQSLQLNVTSLDDVTTTAPDGFKYFEDQAYFYLNESQKLKVEMEAEAYAGPAEEFIHDRDTSQFCDLIGDKYSLKDNWLQVLPENTPSTFFNDQCYYLQDFEFQFGLCQSIYNFLYQVQTLQKYQTNATASELISLLNTSEVIAFSLKLDIYYRASFETIHSKALLSIQEYHRGEKVALLIEQLVFFVATLLLFTILWRLFINDIRNEIHRSKGMLNMIPTEYLQSGNNMKKIHLNKLFMQ